MPEAVPGSEESGSDSQDADSLDLDTVELPTRSAAFGDFDAIKERRVLRIIVPYSKTLFFIVKGRTEGIGAEMTRALEIWLDKRHHASKALRFRVVLLPTARDKLLDDLRRGIGDVVMGNLTVTTEQAELVDFAAPLIENVREVLITGPEGPENFQP